LELGFKYDCLFIDHRQDDGDIFINTRHNGRYQEIKTTYLIGADGPQSKVRRSVSPEFDKSIGWFPVYEELYVGTIDLEPGWLYLFLDREVTAAFASVLNKDNIIHVTTGAKQGESSKKYLKRLVEILKGKHGLKINRTTMKRGIVLNDMTQMQITPLD